MHSFSLREKARMRGYVSSSFYLPTLPNPLPEGEGVNIGMAKKTS
jgi:hypothetical protein